MTGQIKSIASPSDPARTASVPFAVGKGQGRTAKVAGPFGTSIIRKAIWLSSPLSEMLMRRVSAEKSLENVALSRRAWAASALYALAIGKFSAHHMMSFIEIREH